MDFGWDWVIMTNQETKQQKQMKIALAINQPTLCSDYDGEYFWGLLPKDIEDKILKLLHDINIYKLQQEYIDRLTIPRVNIWKNIYEQRRQDKAKGITKELRMKQQKIEQELNDLISASEFRFSEWFNKIPYLDRPPTYRGEHGTRNNGGTYYADNFVARKGSVWGKKATDDYDKTITHYNRGLPTYHNRQVFYGDKTTMYRFRRSRSCEKGFNSDSKMLMDISIHTPLKELKRIWKEDYGFKCSSKINTKNSKDYVSALYKYGGDIIWEESDYQ